MEPPWAQICGRVASLLPRVIKRGRSSVSSYVSTSDLQSHATSRANLFLFQNLLRPPAGRRRKGGNWGNATVTNLTRLAPGSNRDEGLSDAQKDVEV